MTHPHAVVIGGTGMLRRASVAIAQESRAFTAVARTPASLEALARDIGHVSGQLSFLSLDWDQEERFLAGLSRHLEGSAPPSLVVAWLHNVWLGPRIAGVIPNRGTRCELFQVLGSAGRGPESEADGLRNAMGTRPDLAYHQVILGFKRKAGVSRWLTNEEISAGVLAALSARQPAHVIGAVSPWDERPSDAG